MAKPSLTNKEKNRIYELSIEDGFSQNKLASLYDVSQGTISNTLKEKRHEAEINTLKQRMDNAMTRGVRAAIEDGTLRPNHVTKSKYIEG